MAKLYLKFEQNVLKEVPVGQGSVVTVGRLPDNTLQIDNLAVSGHHAKIYWETDHYVVEDNHSLNGTYVNNQRVGKQPLKDADVVLIGKHTVLFKDEWHDEAAAEKPKPAVPALPKMEATVVLDTKKAKELMQQQLQAKAAASGAAAAPSSAPRATVPDLAAQSAGESATPVASASPSSPAAHHKMGALTILEGKTDEQNYLLSSKLTVIGGSKMASVKLKGGFFSSPPDVAAMISKIDDKYFISTQDRKANLRVNGEPVTQKQELKEGDIIQVWKAKIAFSYHE
jgi:pSer/pThr/pTyr-binding forkhead associated (FHA) protein